MSTTSSASMESPSAALADRDDGATPAARPSVRGTDEITVVEVPGHRPLPAFLSARAARPPAGGESDGPAPAGESPTLEGEVKRLQAALNTAAARNRPAPRSGRGEERLSPGLAGARPAGRGLLTPMLSRPGYAVAGMALASMAVAAIAGAFVYVILPQTEDWVIAEAPVAASPEPPPPDAPALPSESGAGANGGEAGRVAQPESRQPALPSLPENQPVEKPLDVAALDLPPDPPARPEPSATAAPDPAPPASAAQPASTPESEQPERAVVMAQALTPESARPTPREAPALAPPLLEPPAPAVAALAPPAKSEPSAAPASSPFASQQSFAMAAPVPSARPEPQPELLAANRMPRHTDKTAAPYRANFQFSDSDVRHLSEAELQRLPAERLRIARNEIFARKGRFFKDDQLRAYFSQFAWYQPRAWDVALSPVEAANVGLIQSVEDAAAAVQPRGAGGPASAETEPGTRITDPRRQYLTIADLQDFSAEQLVLVRNEIFARKGRYFKDPSLRAYFEQFPWYQPYSWDVALNPVEKANVDMILSVEQLRTGRAPPM
jgi:hypothetical protein